VQHGAFPSPSFPLPVGEGWDFARLARPQYSRNPPFPKWERDGTSPPLQDTIRRPGILAAHVGTEPYFSTGMMIPRMMTRCARTKTTKVGMDAITMLANTTNCGDSICNSYRNTMIVHIRSS